MDLGLYTQVASAVIALAGMAGLALFRGSLVTVRDQNKDLRDEVADLHRRYDDNETRRAAEAAASSVIIRDQAADIASLQRVVTGEVQLAALLDLLDHHHKRAEEQWTRDEAVLIDIRNLLRERE